MGLFDFLKGKGKGSGKPRRPANAYEYRLQQCFYTVDKVVIYSGGVKVSGGLRKCIAEYLQGSSDADQQALAVLFQ